MRELIDNGYNRSTDQFITVRIFALSDTECRWQNNILQQQQQKTQRMKKEWKMTIGHPEYTEEPLTYMHLKSSRNWPI